MNTNNVIENEKNYSNYLSSYQQAVTVAVGGGFLGGIGNLAIGIGFFGLKYINVNAL